MGKSQETKLFLFVSRPNEHILEFAAIRVHLEREGFIVHYSRTHHVVTRLRRQKYVGVILRVPPKDVEKMLNKVDGAYQGNKGHLVIFIQVPESWPLPRPHRLPGGSTVRYYYEAKREEYARSVDPPKAFWVPRTTPLESPSHIKSRDEVI